MFKRVQVVTLLTFLTICFSLQAWAAQTLISPTDKTYGYYLSTPTKVYTADGWVYKFSVDGYTYYPNEIYLPNEESPASYRIHSNYNKNTDACASCHSTHTAVGNSLLQWYSNYDTCMACHDGTVATTYNVTEGILPTTMQPTSGGAFGTGAEKYASYHNVTGGVLIGSAPASDPNTGLDNEKPLGCESCHSPHGLGGNARLLNPDPNGVQTQKANNFKDYALVEIPDSAYAVVYVAYPKNEQGQFDFSQEPYYMLKGYPYNITVKINGIATNDVYIDNSAGFTKIKFIQDITGPVTADFIPSLRVRFNIQNYLGFGGPEQEQYIDGTTQFCYACHSKYTMSVNSKVYGHPVGVEASVYKQDSPFYQNVLKNKFEPDKKIVCLTCHVAHGTSSDYWNSEGMAWSAEQLKEAYGSSALKRGPNNTLCDACHDSKTEDLDVNGNLYPLAPYYTQEVGFESYVGNDLVTCGGTKCHQPIVDAFGDTLHSRGLQTASAVNAYAYGAFTANTGLDVSQVVYVIGEKRLQRYVWLDTLDNKLKVAPGAFVVSSKQWMAKNADADFVKDCAGCHVTGLNPASGAWKDNGVTCEACHGSANNHITVPSNRNITNPRFLKPADQSDVCAQCHALGRSSDLEHPYPVGYMPNAEELKNVDRSVYVLSNFFTVFTHENSKGDFYAYPNIGSAVYDSVYPAQEFNDFIQSKHYQSGSMSCITCHSSHKANTEGKMLKKSYVQVCGSCHGTTFDLDTVMPKRVQMTNSTDDNLRVHTFSTNHDESMDANGISQNVH